jgi:hypothetical protein
MTNHIEETKATPSLIALAAARDLLAKAAEASEAAHASQTKLLTKRSELQAAATSALGDFRAGRIDEATAALRKSVAEADLVDAEAMINSGAANLQQLGGALAHAQKVAAEAERAAKREEHSLLAAALDKSLREIEEAFVACLAERARVQYLLTGKQSTASSLFSYWAPSADLSQAVGRFIVPPQRNA